MSSRERTGLLVSVASAYVVAGIGGAVSARSVRTWYRTLDLPQWRPPDSAFGPVWTVLYGTMATAAWLVWRDGRRAGQGRDPGLRLYGVQLALNLGWTLAAALDADIWRRNR